MINKKAEPVPPDQLLSPSGPIHPDDLPPTYTQPRELAQSIKKVKEMQQSLIDFAKTLQQKAELDEPADKDRSTISYNPFISYLLNRSIKKNMSKDPGLEFKEFDNTNTNKDRTQDAIKLKKVDKLNGYLNTINQIGTHSPGKKVNVPDGKWNNYTENAIRNTYSIANGLLNLFNKLDINQTKYTKKDLDNLGLFITSRFEDVNSGFYRSTRKVDHIQLGKNADAVRENIEKLTDLLQTFFNRMIETYGEHGLQTGQELPFPTNYNQEQTIQEESQPIHMYFKQYFGKSDNMVLDERTNQNIPEYQYYTNTLNKHLKDVVAKIPSEFPNLRGTDINITLNDLISFESLKNKISSVKYNGNPIISSNKINREGVLEILAKIREQIYG